MTISRKALLLWTIVVFMWGIGFGSWAGWGIRKDIENSKMAVANYILEHGELPPSGMVVAIPESNQVVIVQPDKSPKLVVLPQGVTTGAPPSPSQQATTEDGFRPVKVR